MAVIGLVAVGLVGCGFMLCVLFHWTRDGASQPIRHRNGISSNDERKIEASPRRAGAIPPLDIFKLEPDGSVVWKGTVTDLGSVELSVKVKVVAFDSPGEYGIYSQETRHKNT
jgi:hypothetical protein